jgi:hypothetical protein
MSTGHPRHVGNTPWKTGEYGEGRVAVKVVDVLDEEWFGVIELAALNVARKSFSVATSSTGRSCF